jgi:hypothetical protein
MCWSGVRPFRFLRVLVVPSGMTLRGRIPRRITKGSIMKATLYTLAVAFAAAGASLPVFARDALPQTTQQALALKDGSTLYVFKDGKMAREDRYGRAAYLKQGEVLELADGRKVPAVGNEVARLRGLLNDGHGN